MERPCILLSASRSGWQNYENAVLRAGGSVAGGYCPQPDAGYDGLLLCGGEAIDPDRYGQKNCGSLGIDPDRDAAEFALAEAYAAAGKPIFGICRGHQVLNVVLGGSLLQDLGPERNLFHRRTPGTDVDRIHPLRTEENSLLRRLYGPVPPPGRGPAWRRSAPHGLVGSRDCGSARTRNPPSFFRAVPPRANELRYAQARRRGRCPSFRVVHPPLRRPDPIDPSSCYEITEEI